MVDRPGLIGNYNKYMGGTDQMDQAIACYRPCIRNKKWYWPLFLYMIKVSMYNSWLLSRRLTDDGPLLNHTRSVVRSYLHKHRYNKKLIPKVQVLHNSKVANRVEDSIRFDGKDHLLGFDHSGKKSRYGLCGKTTLRMCMKCGCKLHDYCFSAFHGLKA